MRFIKVHTILWCFLFLPLCMWGQYTTVRGIVKGGSETLIGATVVWENKEGRVLSGVVTNENGEFVLPVLPDSKGLNIIFSFIGLETQKVKYTGQPSINVTLKESTYSLEEVAITASRTHTNNMGMNSANEGVSRQRINLDEFQDMAVTSVEDMLQGKLTNVDIIAGSGDPGTKMSIRIRGTSSLNASNEPLIVIDGIPHNIDIMDDFDFGTANVEDFGSLLNIAPSDIEEIEVLKDAGATALWGSKAANGVLLVTTKRGTKGKPSFSISQKNSWSWEPKSIEMLNASEYRTLMQDALWNMVHYRGFSPQSLSLLNKFDDIKYNPSYEYFDEFNQETDWMSLLVQQPFNNETSFGMRGGGDKARYYFSVNYLKELGTTLSTDYNRITTRLNLDYDFSTRLKVSSSFSYAEGKRNQPYSNPRSGALVKMPNMSPWVLDNDGNPTDVYFTQPATSIQGAAPNPLALAADSKNIALNRTMNANFSLSYSWSGFVLNSTVAFGLGTNRFKTFNPEQASGVKWSSDDYNLASDGTSNSVSINTRTILTYRKHINNHEFNGSFLAETAENNNSSYQSTVSAIGSGEVADPSAGGKVTRLSSSDGNNRSVGFAGNFNYGYGRRYYITVGARSEASSKTGRNSRWGFLPRATALWHFHEEDFCKQLEWFSLGTASFSWGRSGNAPSGSYTYVGTFEPEDSYMSGNAIKPSSMQLNKLKWETTESYTGVLKLGFLNDRIELVLEYYLKETSDLLQKDMSISSSTGYEKVGWYNSGKSQNKGWEITLNMPNIIKVNGFTLSVNNLNISRNRNAILELPSNRVDEAAKEANGTYANRIIEGQPLGAFYGYQCLGVYQNTTETYAINADGSVMYDFNGKPVVTSIFGNKNVYPGDARYVDRNYDGIINKYDMVYLGNSMPIMTGGGSIRLAYKGLSLRTSFHFRVGQKIINRSRINSEAMYNGDNQRKSVLRRWRYEGDDTDIPRALYQDGYNYLGSDRFVEDNSFLKCKDVTLSYTLPKHIVQKAGFTRCNIYMTTYNLFTITKYKGQDPETPIPSGFSQLAEDTSMTPRARKMAIGIVLDF